jgi:hypothetical protein
MDKVRNPSNSVCYTPSSEPYRIYSYLVTITKKKSIFHIFVSGPLGDARHVFTSIFIG